MMDTETFLTAVQAKDWYAVAAIVIGALVYILKKQAPTTIWGKIPAQWRWLVPITMGALTGFVAAFQEGKTWAEALVQAAVAAFYAGLPASAGHHVLVDLPFLPYGDGKEK